MPQLEKQRLLSTTGERVRFDSVIIYSDFITDRAITGGSLKLQGNECLKVILVNSSSFLTQKTGLFRFFS